jgi:hypothetical protein
MTAQTIQALVGKDRFESFHNDRWGRSLILKWVVEAAELSYWDLGFKAECGYRLASGSIPRKLSEPSILERRKVSLENLSRLSENDSRIALHILSCGSLRLTQTPLD